MGRGERGQDPRGLGEIRRQLFEDFLPRVEQGLEVPRHGALVSPEVLAAADDGLDAKLWMIVEQTIEKTVGKTVVAAAKVVDVVTHPLSHGKKPPAASSEPPEPVAAEGIPTSPPDRPHQSPGPG